jgi:FKBP-type peptidyl-prolyl cis-trans isomerase 2
MQSEKIAVIALVVIIAGALSAYLIATYAGDLTDTLFPPPVSSDSGIIQYGDCVDINYIGRYASNNTIFDSSYTDPGNKTDGTPLKVYVSSNQSASPPSGYSNYSAGIIEGLMTRLIGLEEGEEYTLGPIPPAEAYGDNQLEVGDTFNTSNFALNTIKSSLSLNQTLMITQLNVDNMSLQWVNFDDLGNFTMPQIVLGDLNALNQEDMIIIPPPYFIWENSSTIISSTEDYVTVKTTPTKTEHLTDSFEQIQFGFGNNDLFILLPNETTASYDESTITLTSNPSIGDVFSYSYEYFGQLMTIHYEVKNMTNTTIGLIVSMEGTNETQNQTVTRTLTFNRTYQLTRTYKNIPTLYQDSLIGLDLEREGYSIHPLAGESLIFDVTIEKVYKTSGKKT